MKFKYFLSTFIIVLLSPTTWAHLENTYLLEGKNNEGKFSLQIQNFDGSYFARYYQDKDLKDHVLKGTCDSNYCAFVGGNWKEGKFEITDSIYIQENKKHEWNGKWYTFDQKKTVKKIHLKTIKDTIKDNIVYNDISLYQRKRLDKTSFIIDSNIVREPHANITFINPKVNDSIADYINVFREKIIDKSLSCTSFGIEGVFQYSEILHFANDTILSFSAEIKSDCDGTGISTIKENFNINKKGKNSQLEDFIYFGNAPKPAYQSNDWYIYRYNNFAPKLIDLIKAKYPRKFGATDNFCDLNQENTWQFPDWYITPSGIAITPYFGINDEDCQSQKQIFIVPFQ